MTPSWTGCSPGCSGPPSVGRRPSPHGTSATPTGQAATRRPVDNGGRCRRRLLPCRPSPSTGVGGARTGGGPAGATAFERTAEPPRAARRGAAERRPALRADGRGPPGCDDGRVPVLRRLAGVPVAGAAGPDCGRRSAPPPSMSQRCTARCSPSTPSSAVSKLERRLPSTPNGTDSGAGAEPWPMLPTRSAELPRMSDRLRDGRLPGAMCSALRSALSPGAATSPTRGRSAATDRVRQHASFRSTSPRTDRRRTGPIGPAQDVVGSWRCAGWTGPSPTAAEARAASAASCGGPRRSSPPRRAGAVTICDRHGLRGCRPLTARHPVETFLLHVQNRRVRIAGSVSPSTSTATAAGRRGRLQQPRHRLDVPISRRCGPHRSSGVPL